MDEVKRMLIERACERLAAEYCHLVDNGQAAKVADLFAEDGVWNSQNSVMNGRAEIRAAFQRRQDRAERISRHVCCNPLIQVLDEYHASGAIYLTLYRHDGDLDGTVAPSVIPTMIGEYRDRFVRTAEGWRFAHRALSLSFAVERK